MSKRIRPVTEFYTEVVEHTNKVRLFLAREVSGIKLADIITNEKTCTYFAWIYLIYRCNNESQERKSVSQKNGQANEMVNKYEIINVKKHIISHTQSVIALCPLHVSLREVCMILNVPFSLLSSHHFQQVHSESLDRISLVFSPAL